MINSCAGAMRRTRCPCLPIFREDIQRKIRQIAALVFQNGVVGIVPIVRGRLRCGAGAGLCGARTGLRLRPLFKAAIDLTSKAIGIQIFPRDSVRMRAQLLFDLFLCVSLSGQ
jgi:hypothetical protein